MALAQGVLEVIENAARERGFKSVKSVWLEIGRLAAVEAEALRFCFEAVTHGSLAEGCRLEIIATPGTAWCHACGRAVSVQAVYDPCPACGGFSLQVTGGTEMRVKELEVD
jgi:hydrogenase nickel incorporation protein HypA/HybF